MSANDSSWLSRSYNISHQYYGDTYVIYHSPPPVLVASALAKIHTQPITHPVTYHKPHNAHTDSIHKNLLPTMDTLHNLPPTSHTTTVMPTHTNPLPYTYYIHGINTHPTLCHYSPVSNIHIPAHDTQPISMLGKGLNTTRLFPPPVSTRPTGRQHQTSSNVTSTHHPYILYSLPPLQCHTITHDQPCNLLYSTTTTIHSHLTMTPPKYTFMGST